MQTINLAERYINGLKKAYIDNGTKEMWEHFEKVKHGAKRENLMKIKAECPSVPTTLLALLEYADGTYHREYKGEELAFYFFGSDVDECGYPYYLLSTEQLLEEVKFGKEHGYSLYDFLDWINEHGYFELHDDKLIKNPDEADWLCFSHCMNNGGTSQLFIDFTPSEKGKAGQIVRFLHDPDQYKVIADSFDDYLEMLIDTGYSFINEETICS